MLIAIPNPINELFVIMPNIMLSEALMPDILSIFDKSLPIIANAEFVIPADVAVIRLTSSNDLCSSIICELTSPINPVTNVTTINAGRDATSVIAAVTPPTTAPIAIPTTTFYLFAAADTPTYIPPNTAPIATAIKSEVKAKCPE